MVILSDNIFATVSKKDHLSLFRKGRPEYNRIKKFLGFKKEDISKATGVPVNSIRFDHRVPPEIQERMTEWANLLNLVAEYFDGDPDKTALWFITPNPLLGGNITPRDMIRLGRYEKLFKFVFNALSENKR